MDKNNIVIYGNSGCGWCQKQLEEFGGLVNGLINKGLYIDCADSDNREVCSDVRGTPSWKVNNKLVDSGYKPLEEIIPSFN